MVTIEKLESTLLNEEMKIKLTPNEKLDNLITSIFYLKERQNRIVIETKRIGPNKYENKIIKNNGFNFLDSQRKDFLETMEILGQKTLERMPNKNTTRSCFETFLYTLDPFGIKRLNKYFLK